MEANNSEKIRLAEDQRGARRWKFFGPYLSERQWGRRYCQKLNPRRRGFCAARRFPRDSNGFVMQLIAMTTTEAAQLLDRFRAGKIPREKVLRAFQSAPIADLGFAQVDMHRALRKNFPEVIFGAGKTPEQVVKIAACSRKNSNLPSITHSLAV
jgi:hypothetical protein